MPSKISYYYEMGRKIGLAAAVPKLWNYVKYRSLAKDARTSHEKVAPQIASLMLTKRCNLACAYCSAGNLINLPGQVWRADEADLEKVKRIFANPLFAKCLLVDLLGGEPLLVDDLEAIVRYLVGRGHIVNMATNGLLLAKRIVGLKRAGISRINLSLYRENREVLERDLPGINRVFPVHASFVLLRSEVDNPAARDALLETTRFVHDAGCQSLRLYGYRPIGSGPTPDEIIPAGWPVFDALRARIDREFPGFCVWPALVKKDNVRKRCPQLWQRVNCDMSGNMGICCGTDAFLRGPNSNLFDGPPDAVFNHPTLVSMREQLLDPRRPAPEICRTCNLLDEPGW